MNTTSVSTEFEIEIANTFCSPQPGEEFVYSHLDRPVEIEETRIYRIAGDGSRSELEDFVEDVLADPVSEEWAIRTVSNQSETEFLLDDAVGYIDVYLKKNVLDLEEQYLTEFREHAGEPGFQIDDLRIIHRYYVFGTDVDSDLLGTIRTDLANPVIHEWSVETRENGN